MTYQMHGLVCVDKNKQVLRPSIIWCDSRAVPYGEKATAAIGAKKCLEIMLNHRRQLYRRQTGMGQGQRAGYLRTD